MGLLELGKDLARAALRTPKACRHAIRFERKHGTRGSYLAAAAAGARNDAYAQALSDLSKGSPQIIAVGGFKQKNKDGDEKETVLMLDRRTITLFVLTNQYNAASQEWLVAGDITASLIYVRGAVVGDLLQPTAAEQKLIRTYWKNMACYAALLLQRAEEKRNKDAARQRADPDFKQLIH